jgi:hypothetical protein
MKRNYFIAIALSLVLLAVSLAGCNGNTPATLTFNGGVLPEARVGSEYAADVAATGASGIGYALKNGSTLPAGLVISAQGHISGTPTAAVEEKAFTVVASASGANLVEAAFTITVKAVLAYQAPTLPPATSGIAYSVNIATATGATGIQYALKSGSTLPAGLSLSAAGVISGTPTATVADAQFIVLATAAGAISAEAQFSLTVVAAGSIVYNGGTLSDAKINVAYNGSVATAAGAAGITYALKSGSALPAGLTLNDAGAISGTPTAVVAAASFTVVASAAELTSVEATFVLTVADIEPVKYTFETEYIFVDDLIGAGSSGALSGKNMIGPSEGASNGYFLGYTSRAGLAMTFVIQSNASASAVLSLSLGTDQKPLTMDATSFEISVNGTIINYQQFGVPVGTNPYYVVFNEYVIIPSITLAEGTNTILFTTRNSDFYDGLTIGPQFDCIYITTVAELSWSPYLDNTTL